MGFGDRALRFLSVAAIALAVAVPGVPAQVATIAPGFNGDAIVRVAPGHSDSVAAFARRAGAQDVQSLDTLDVVTAHLDASATRALAGNVAVRAIEADGAIAASDLGPRESELPRGNGPAVNEAHAFRTLATGNGASITVAVVDSGVAENRDLSGKVLTRVDFVNDGVSSYDPGGHGTYVAGLIAGSVTGVNATAKIVSLRVLNERGVGRSRDALAAFDWLLRHRADYGVRVVNLSWGAVQRSSYDTDVLAAAAESLWFAGMTVVAAAGNDGPRAGTINTPGSDPFIITVGSVDQGGTLPRGDDRESVWSSRGPTLDGFAKPELLAPGEDVVSLRVPGSFLDRWYSDHDSETGPRYTTMSGTSVSAAIVSGTASLLLSEHPSLTPTLVKTVLVGAAMKVRGSNTPELDPSRALHLNATDTRKPANSGLRPSKLLLTVLAGMIGGSNITWENLTWESITWQTITWENITWESLTWESVTWESLTWEARRK
ncbi:MAG: hypothetical protein AUH85_00205 [Chloroflexi bacterium 13_1_40CM_4_68_4]|nr:MAG: hypothetical protein AUH85_00205 [Chloroflexi bacterium 13_1_40CM_4_68_4]